MVTYTIAVHTHVYHAFENYYLIILSFIIKYGERRTITNLNYLNDINLDDLNKNLHFNNQLMYQYIPLNDYRK